MKNGSGNIIRVPRKDSVALSVCWRSTAEVSGRICKQHVAKVDTEELNPKYKGVGGRGFGSKIVILLTKDTQLITGRRHFIS